MAELTPDEIKFFETGELQPGMQAVSDPTPVVPAQLSPTPAVPEPPANPTPVEPNLQNEAADILRQSLAEAQQRVGALEANIQQLKQVHQKVDTPAPDPDVDPLGAMMHKLENVNKVVADLQSQLVQQQTQRDQLSNFQQFQQQVNVLRDQFVKTAPDFPDAYAHIRNVRISDLRAFGLTDQQIQQTVFQEEATLAQNAIKFGKNPAEVIYDMAKRHGYIAKAATTTTSANPDAKLASVQQAQAASKSLPSTPNLEDITVDGLKGASDADLTKLVNDPKMWSKIVGSDQYPL